MIIYERPLGQFIQECFPPSSQKKDISDIVAEAMRAHGLSGFDESQKHAWSSSLPEMAEVLRDSSVDRSVEVAIEYKPSASRDRIDFLIGGSDESGRQNLVIIELEQWSDIEKSSKTDFVFAHVAHNVWEDHWHPSYQAGNYANILKNSNAYIQDTPVGLASCSFLHNMPEDKEGYLDDVTLFPLVKSSPAYLKDDIEKLRRFIERYVSKPYRSPKGLPLLWEIDNSALRPSFYLADRLEESLKGNGFFSYDEGQATAVSTIVEAVRKAKYYHQKKTILIQGGPGSGKSVVALNAMGQLMRGTLKRGRGGKALAERLTACYVTANASPKNLYKKELTQGRYDRAFLKDLFKDPSSFVSSKENDFDCILVDEAHRVYDHASGSHGIPKEGPNAIELLIRSALVTVFFVDSDQRVTKYDYGTIDHIKRAAWKYHSEVVEGPQLTLTSEFRCLGWEEYMAFVRGFLGYPGGMIKYQRNERRYDFQIFDYAQDMMDAIRRKDREEQEKLVKGRLFNDSAVSGRCRLVAGYTYDWVTKGESREEPGYDIALDVGSPKPFHAKWNLRYSPNGSEYSWLDDPFSVGEVGCIHTCQGLDMPYCGVIIGRDLTYNKTEGRIEFHREANAKTDTASGIHASTVSDEVAKELIRNTYHVLLTRGIKGTYVYCEDRDLRDYLRSLVK